MAIAPRQSEVNAVMDAIEGEKSLEGVAKAAIKASYAALQARPAPGEKLTDKGLWVVATPHRLIYGPFGTYGEAERAVANGHIPNFEKIDPKKFEEEGLVPSPEFAILPMQGPASAAAGAIEKEREARLFANHLCATPGCEHKLARHNDKTGKCPARNCTCTKPKEIKL